MIQIAKSAAIDEKIRLRPSVSWVERANNEIEFFYGNTRRQKSYIVSLPLVKALRQLNGEQTLELIAQDLSIPSHQILAWATKLIESSAAERISVAEWVQSSPWRRSLTLLADFIPDYDLQDVWSRIGETQFVILGCGAVGSWVADGIARMGGNRFLIIDPDTVALSNLNRSLYTADDVGEFKTTALANRLREINSNAVIEEQRESINATSDLDRLVVLNNNHVVISCIDQPSVDIAAGITNLFCVSNGIPLVVAGGYNLHLSLIGITVIPGKTACFDCSLTHLKRSQLGDQLQVKKLPRPSRNIGNIAPLAAITASIAGMEAIRVAARDLRISPAMQNRRGEFNFMGDEFYWMDIPKQIDCPTCSNLALLAGKVHQSRVA